MNKIENALKEGKSLKKTKARLGAGNNQMFSLINLNREIVNNRKGLIEVAQNFYSKLFKRNQGVDTVELQLESISEVPKVTEREIE